MGRPYMVAEARSETTGQAFQRLAYERQAVN
jgi:hypothetical protein